MADASRKYIIQRRHTKLGEYLKKKRLAKGLSQQEVADILGYSSSQFISNFECGIYAPPLKKLKTMVHLYDLSVDLLMSIIMEEEKRYLKTTLIKKSSRRSTSA